MTDAEVLEGIDALSEEDDVKVGTLNKGRITINSQFRKKLDTEDGANIVMWIDDNEEQIIGMKIINDELFKEMIQ